MKSFLYASIPLVLLGLSGCSSLYEDSFECPAGSGVSCRSISEVHEMVNRGEVGQKESFLSPLEDQGSASQASETLLSPFKEEQLSKDASRKKVSRRPEKTLRVWLAPHLEESGIWSGERYVYTVIEPGAWVEESRSWERPSS